ncbi:MAG: hypothetical protein MAG453_02113 [Calditrichaeota bacterium]|nr:hypothetical protein [Calditrichota bacterium]
MRELFLSTWYANPDLLHPLTTDVQTTLETVSEPTVLYVDRHLELGDQGLSTLDLPPVLTVRGLQQGSLVLLGTSLLTIGGLFEGAPVARPWIEENNYPGGFFRFEDPDVHPFHTHVTIAKANTVNASWFGLPNLADFNAWLLRKCLLAAEDAKIPVYLPPGNYSFDGEVFPEAEESPNSHRFRGSKAGTSVLSTFDAPNGNFLFRTQGGPDLTVNDPLFQRLAFEGTANQDFLLLKHVDGLYLGRPSREPRG